MRQLADHHQEQGFLPRRQLPAHAARPCNRRPAGPPLHPGSRPSPRRKRSDFSRPPPAAAGEPARPDPALLVSPRPSRRNAPRTCLPLVRPHHAVGDPEQCGTMAIDRRVKLSQRRAKPYCSSFKSKDCWHLQMPAARRRAVP
jgi:hypothetical protein